MNPDTQSGQNGGTSPPLAEIATSDELTPAHYLAQRQDGLTFMACVRAASADNTLVAEVDRLCGTNLLQRQAPIVNMIDEATGKADRDKQAFLHFVWNCIFIRVAPLT